MKTMDGVPKSHARVDRIRQVLAPITHDSDNLFITAVRGSEIFLDCSLRTVLFIRKNNFDFAASQYF